MPVQAREHVRKMRGGAHAHLMLADDDHFYVVKFRNNPQHPRILVNELIAYTLLDYLQLPAPPWDLVEVPRSLIAVSPDLSMEKEHRIVRCEPGLHFGSRYPLDPSAHAVYDYLPSSILRTVLNRNAFLGVLVFDKWVNNVNGRQAIFFRDRAGRWLASGGVAAEEKTPPRSVVYVANMIDHGFAFNAHRWKFADSPERGLYLRREVYENVTGLESFEPWLTRARECPPEVLDDAYKRIPPEWLGADFDLLEDLLERLFVRRGNIAALVRAAKDAAGVPFPNWMYGVSPGWSGGYEA